MLPPQNLTKLYYTMGEVAEMFNVNTSLLRYWDKEFKVLQLKKNRKGDRRFTALDIEVVAKIYTLVKERGFTLDGAKMELKNNSLSSSKESTIKENLIAIQKRLNHIKIQMETLLDNIA